MSKLSYDELEAYTCGYYSYEPAPDRKHVLSTSPDGQFTEDRRPSVPKLWLAPYKSRFRERFTPCSSEDEADYETSPEDAESEYEDCLPVPPKSELRNNGLGIPHNKNREVRIIDSILHGGDEEVDGVDVNIDLSLIDGSCGMVGSRRPAGLPPVPPKSPKRQSLVMEKDVRIRQDSSLDPSYDSDFDPSLMVAPLNIVKKRSNNESSSETLVSSSTVDVARSSPKSVTPPEHSDSSPSHTTELPKEPTCSSRRVGPARLRGHFAAFSFEEDDADDEGCMNFGRRQFANGLYADAERRRASGDRHFQLNQKSRVKSTAQQDSDGNFETSRALQQGKQSLDDKYLMDLMQVHPAVRMEAFKRNLHVLRDGPLAAQSERRRSGYRFESLDGLVAGKDDGRQERMVLE
ncbi:uncharacterized protein CLAFUR5_20120 [Fulvia fulva]|uniref:uncharacterized protein n=1 Tax=Passalora fulva TaxID=5499 RepID=UPI002852970A|nr:uncharacterized protein CLAFUR5_20120 [Fulvia fulva]WMI38746.1 hypothetical protein CLAFUR5_20120 [Fulvia fulva]